MIEIIPIEIYYEDFSLIRFEDIQFITKTSDPIRFFIEENKIVTIRVKPSFENFRVSIEKIPEKESLLIKVYKNKEQTETEEVDEIILPFNATVDIKIKKEGLVRVRFTQPPEIESKNQ
ncbi:MAG: hypothetical protein JHC31_05270 [Sulfurihydrogenibium sp.]|jgi:hypothetical protein|nr:hypothetical protein [Sulfurihydrogenibium sp.]